MHVVLDPTSSVQGEVEEIWPREGQIRVCGTVTGAEAGAGSLLIQARDAEEAQLPVPTLWQSNRFEARIPLEPLASGCPASERTWDLDLALPGQKKPLRLGTHLDDVVGKKKIFTYPAQRAAGVRIAPFYTVKDTDSIAGHRETV